MKYQHYYWFFDANMNIFDLSGIPRENKSVAVEQNNKFSRGLSSAGGNTDSRLNTSLIDRAYKRAPVGPRLFTR